MGCSHHPIPFSGMAERTLSCQIEIKPRCRSTETTPQPSTNFLCGVDIDWFVKAATLQTRAQAAFYVRASPYGFSIVGVCLKAVLNGVVEAAALVPSHSSQPLPQLLAMPRGRSCSQGIVCQTLENTLVYSNGLTPKYLRISGSVLSFAPHDQPSANKPFFHLSMTSNLSVQAPSIAALVVPMHP